MKTFKYDNTLSSTFGLYINGRGVYDSPEPDLEYITIPGRSGDLVYDNKRFRNIEIRYPAVFMLKNFRQNFKAFQAFLLSHKGYYRLEDDYLPDHYRMASVEEAVELEDIDWVYDAGSFDIKLNCKPQLFLKSGDTATTFTASGTISNPTLFASKPLVRVYGKGTLTVGNVTLVIGTHGFAYIDIDCELMDCYYQGQNANPYVTVGNAFPELAPGSNNITFGSGHNFTKVEVTPRWWTV